MKGKEKTIERWIEQLALTSHPEGGYFRETYRSNDVIDADGLPERYDSSRKAYTSIYYLLPSGEVSKFHRLKSDEIWNFYWGSPLLIHIIDRNGNYRKEVLGANLDNGEFFQRMVEAGNWFGAEVVDENSYTLAGCFVAPGFDFEDFELADTRQLKLQYPQYVRIIDKLS